MKYLLCFIIAGLCILYFALLRRAKRDAQNDTLPTDRSRRRFFSFSTNMAQAKTMQGLREKVNSGVAIIENKQTAHSKRPIIPAGGESFDRMSHLCNACQLCVEVCPTRALQPKISMDSLMIPQLILTDNCCLWDCTKCNDVCPTNALKKISVEEKTDIKIGRAVWLKKNCIAMTEGTDCDACEKACPNGSVKMLQNGRKRFPVINEGSCIGCGMCVAACKANPIKAIYIEGFAEHQTL